MDIGNFLQNLFQPQTISSGVPSSASYGTGQGMPPETDVLQRILGGNPVNVMQQAGITPDMAQPAPVPQAPQPAAQAPRPRRSLLETIGRISDVLATTGGAQPLYEPTINAREDRARQIQADQQKLAMGNFELGDKGNARTGMAVRGLQAIMRQNPNADPSTVWPLIAQHAGVDPEHISQLSQVFATNPAAIDGLAEALNGHEGKYAKQVNIAVDPATGKTIAYQVDDMGNVHQVQLPENYNPVDPIQAINTGGATQIVGRNTGTVKKVLPNTERPGQAADRDLRRDIANQNSRDRLTIAGVPARAQPGQAGGPSAAAATALPLLSDMREALTRFRNAGGIAAPGMTGKGRLNSAALENVPLYERVTNPESYSARQDLNRLATEGVFQLLPLMSPTIKVGSRNFDTEKEFQRLSNAILNAKDYNSALRGIQDMENLINAGLKQPTAAPSAPAAPRRTVKPAPSSNSGGWGKATVVGR